MQNNTRSIRRLGQNSEQKKALPAKKANAGTLFPRLFLFLSGLLGRATGRALVLG